MGISARFSALAVLIGAFLIYRAISKEHGLDKDAVVQIFRSLSERLGFWAIPVYVLFHTVSLALCLPYAVFLEAGASLLFGFFPAVLCVMSAKVLGASLSFWIGRVVFRSSSSAMEWVQRSKYFHIITKGVEQDGWRFVLLARFSPMPSYVINYALAATKVRFFVDFLLPTVIGCLPMILQNTSIGSLAGAAVASTTGSQRSHLLSYVLPFLGIISSILISLRIKKYSSAFSGVEETQSSSAPDNDPLQDICPTATPGSKTTVFINGYPCKNPATVVASDFKSSKLNHAGDTDNFLASSLNLVTAIDFSGLNTLGLSIARTDYDVDGIVPPHLHPRASEMFYVIEGVVLVGFVDSSNKLFQRTLRKGDVFVLPKGLLHFSLNAGYEPATGFSVLNSQNPGVVRYPDAFFRPEGSVLETLARKLFRLSALEVGHIRNVTMGLE